MASVHYPSQAAPAGQRIHVAETGERILVGPESFAVVGPHTGAYKTAGPTWAGRERALDALALDRDRDATAITDPGEVVFPTLEDWSDTEAFGSAGDTIRRLTALGLEHVGTSMLAASNGMGVTRILRGLMTDDVIENDRATLRSTQAAWMAAIVAHRVGAFFNMEGGGPTVEVLNEFNACLEGILPSAIGTEPHSTYHSSSVFPTWESFIQNLHFEEGAEPSDNLGELFLHEGLAHPFLDGLSVEELQRHREGNGVVALVSMVSGGTTEAGLLIPKLKALGIDAFVDPVSDRKDGNFSVMGGVTPPTSRPLLAIPMDDRVIHTGHSAVVATIAAAEKYGWDKIYTTPVVAKYYESFCERPLPDVARIAA